MWMDWRGLHAGSERPLGRHACPYGGVALRRPLVSAQVSLLLVPITRPFDVAHRVSHDWAGAPLGIGGGRIRTGTGGREIAERSRHRGRWAIGSCSARWRTGTPSAGSYEPCLDHSGLTDRVASARSG